ncbi:hypothetical protein SAMN04487934_101312 [Eubacterium ruminantium]|nr:hypothetical protein SAMN04487934_101312 [Eubacterium ruminantium]
MQIIDEIVPKENKIYDKAKRYFNPEEVLMFDIETTGLSASSSFVYIIGINYYKNGEWHITLLFNDDGRSEPEIIETFMRLLPEYKYLIEFNGDTFDVPFVKKRLEYINTRLNRNIPDNFYRVHQLDLYKIIRPYKAALGLSNLKQKTIERFVGIDRIDQMNGGELINVYFDYLSSRSERDRSLLLQHNRDDMDGMFCLIDIFALRSLGNGDFTVKNIEITGREKLRIKFHLDLKIFPEMNIAASLRDKTISMNKLTSSSPLLLISAAEKEASLSIPISIGIFKLIHKYYKQYNYYPELDCAYHKDLAPTLTAYNAEPAKASNCYTKTEGYFIEKYKFPEGRTFYREEDEISSKSSSFIELSDDFLGDSELVEEYVHYIVNKILTH